MSTTAFLSMWISNTATAAMMLPIAQAVLLEIKDEAELVPDSAVLGERRLTVDDMVTPVRYTRQGYNSTTHGGSPSHMDGGSVTIEAEQKEPDSYQSSSDSNNGVRDGGGGATSIGHNSSSSSTDKRFDRLAKSLMLGVAYSANIGGTGTLTGTGPNIVLAGLAGYVCCWSFSVYLHHCFHSCSDLGINFGLWFVFATPTMLLALFLSWLYLSAIYCDDRYWNSEMVLHALG